MAQRHWYWAAYVGPGAAFAAGEVATEGPITSGAQVIALQGVIARAVGLSDVVITTWTLLRVEDTDGQVQ
jgi:hypothetical protein